MTEGTPDLGKGTDIDAAELDVEKPVDTPATSDEDEFVGDDSMGGTGGKNAGGAG